MIYACSLRATQSTAAAMWLWQHPHGFAVMQALIDGKVIGDFRAPNLMRFGFAPLYLRFVDVWEAVQALAKILHTGVWQRPEYQKEGVM